MNITKSFWERLWAPRPFPREEFSRAVVEVTERSKFKGRKPAGANASRRELFRDLYAQGWPKGNIRQMLRNVQGFATIEPNGSKTYIGPFGLSLFARDTADYWNVRREDKLVA